MKHSILSIILLALIISLTATVGSSNLITAYAIENYLQLRSANVDYHGGEIDVDIRTGGNIPSESGNNGFGYAVLTDVGDESVDNVLVAISDVGIKNNDKFNTYVLDLTGDTSSACSGSDYEVTKSSSDNEGFDTNYPIDIKGNEISIDEIDTNDLASGTVKAIASFTAEAITNNGKIKQICIDIQDILKQSEINVSYNNDDDDDNDDHDKDDDKNKNRHKDDNKKDNDDKDKSQHKDDNDDDSLFKTDIDQDIDQSNECSGSSTCSNEGSNEVDVFEPENSGDNDGFDFNSNLDIDQNIEQSNECNGEASCSNEANNDVDIGGGSSDNSYIDGTDLDIDQSIGQSNICGDEADCRNEANNEANLWEDINGNSDMDIDQSIEQSNECNGEASCSNEGNNEANVFGYSSAADDEDYDFGSDVDISQSIEQSNTCGGSATCSNTASNVANVG